MKKFWEGLKDILYDSTDYFIMIAIVGVVALVIGWRLDLLFANNIVDAKPASNIIAEKEEQVGGKSEVIIPKEEEKEEDLNITIESKTVEIVIPNGSLPSTIGSILETNGLVPSKDEFVQKSQDMKLDTKLKSGNYQIKTNTPMEDIVQLLTK